MKFLFILFLLTISITAQSSEDTDSHKENSHHIIHHNHIALFIGGTSFFQESENHFSLGLDYVYRPDVEKPWAFSIFGEAIFAEHTEFLVGIPFYYKVLGDWWFRAGPGIELAQEESEETHESETHIKFLFRVGTGYPFHIGDFTITPSLDYDFIRNHDAIVWGINFGYGF